MEDFRHMSMRGLVAPLLYQDFSEKNSMHFGNLNEAQFTLFWTCWQHNLRVINDTIPLITSYKTYGPAMKVSLAALIKSGTRAFIGIWRCGEHNLRLISASIPIMIRNKTSGPAMKVFMAALIKSGTWAIMRYLRGLSKELFNGQVPEDIVERYSRKRSVTATMPSRL